MCCVPYVVVGTRPFVYVTLLPVCVRLWVCVRFYANVCVEVTVMREFLCAAPPPTLRVSAQACCPCSLGGSDVFASKYHRELLYCGSHPVLWG